MSLADARPGAGRGVAGSSVITGMNNHMIITEPRSAADDS